MIDLPFHPEPKYCIKCKDLKKNCDGYDFSKMRKYREYAGVAIIVHCKEFKDKYE